MCWQLFRKIVLYLLRIFGDLMFFLHFYAQHAIIMISWMKQVQCKTHCYSCWSNDVTLDMRGILRACPYSAAGRVVRAAIMQMHVWSIYPACHTYCREHLFVRVLLLKPFLLLPHLLHLLPLLHSYHKNSIFSTIVWVVLARIRCSVFVRTFVWHLF